MEILVIGYLSLKKFVKDFEIDQNYLKSLLSYFENNQISPNLIAELNKHVHFFFKFFSFFFLSQWKRIYIMQAGF